MSGDSEPVLEWEVRQWEREPHKRLVVFAAAFGAAAMGFLIFGSAILATVGFLAILANTSDYWLPVRNRVDATGCSVRYGLSVSGIDWPDVKRVIASDVGVKLSPLGETSRLSPFRGVFLRFKGNREEVLEAIRARCEEDVQFLDGGAD